MSRKMNGRYYEEEDYGDYDDDDYCDYYDDYDYGDDNIGPGQEKADERKPAALHFSVASLLDKPNPAPVTITTTTTLRHEKVPPQSPTKLAHPPIPPHFPEPLPPQRAAASNTVLKAFSEIAISAKNKTNFARPSSSAQRMFLDEVPSDALLIICHFLPLPSVSSLSCTSKFFNEIFSMTSLFLTGTGFTHPHIGFQVAVEGIKHLCIADLDFPENLSPALCNSVRKFALEAGPLEKKSQQAYTFKLAASVFYDWEENVNPKCDPIYGNTKFSITSDSENLSIFSHTENFSVFGVTKVRLRSVWSPSCKHTEFYSNASKKTTTGMFFNNANSTLYTSHCNRVDGSSASLRTARISPNQGIFVKPETVFAQLPHSMNYITSPGNNSTILAANLCSLERNSVPLYSMYGGDPIYTIPADPNMKIQCCKTVGEEPKLIILGGTNCVRIYDTRTKPVVRAEMWFSQDPSFSPPSMEVASGRIFILRPFLKGLFFTEEKVIKNIITSPIPEFPPPRKLRAREMQAVLNPSSMCITTGHILHASSDRSLHSFDIRGTRTPFSSTTLNCSSRKQIVKLVGDETKLVCLTEEPIGGWNVGERSFAEIIPHFRGKFLENTVEQKAITWARGGAAASRRDLTTLSPTTLQESAHIQDIELHKRWLGVGVHDGVRMFDLSCRDVHEQSYPDFYRHFCEKSKAKIKMKGSAASLVRQEPTVSVGEASAAQDEDEIEKRKAAIRARQQAKKLKQIGREKGKKAATLERRKERR